MPKPMRHISRSLAVATAILSLISYLPLPSGMGRSSALATTVAARPALALPALQGEPAVQQLKEQGLYDSLSEALAATRYKLSWAERPALSGLPPAYQAANPAQRFAAYFTPGELHLAPLAAEREAGPEGPAPAPAAWQGTMRLVGYGYGEQLLPVGAFAELAAQENRIEYRRPALPLTEWYVNKAEGLEQGFDIDEPPGARAEGSRLRLALEVTGDLRAELVEAGQAIALRHVNGEMALRYGELHAYDANEQALPAQLRVEGGRVILEVEDARAVYPVTIDPLFTQQQKLTASDGAHGDWFGYSVAISGDTVVVGAYMDDFGAGYDQGSVYVFVRSGTTWSEQQKLTAGNTYLFGSSVAISGDTIVVGADWVNSAYVFVRSGTTWTQQQKLTGADGEVFGKSVAISGDTVVVGATEGDFGSDTHQGSVYVFVRSGTSWSQQQQLTASDGAVFDYFGTSVAISGDTIVVGARGISAYVFVRSGTTWTQQQKLTASGGAESVAISGDTVVVGSVYDDIGDNADQGSAYVFVRSGTSWTQQQKLTASDGAADDEFGSSVAISGDTAIVGSSHHSISANANQSSAYVFVRRGATWSEQQKLTASDGAADDWFGKSVAVSGDTVVVGSPRDGIGANTNQGSAYVFATWGEQQKLSALDGAAQDLFGFSVAISWDTVVVGAYLDDVGANADQGSAYVFVRTGTSWSLQQKLMASDGAASDAFGYSVAISGNTAVVGSYLDDIGDNANQGSAYVFVRSGTTWTQQQKLKVNNGAASDFFGSSVDINGVDINGDGDTVVVGAHLGDVGANTNQGSAYVFVRTGTSWSFEQKLTASDGDAGDRFGISVAVSGDTVVVGAHLGYVRPNTDQGSAYVFVRSRATWTQQQKLTASSGAANDEFGYSVDISGDTVVVGAPYDDIGFNPDQGSAYVFVRSGTSWSQEKKLTASDGAAYDQFGRAVAVSSDKAVVGASNDDIGANSNQGSAYVFVGSGATWSQTQKLTGRTGTASDRLGYSVDINGNTVVVGAPYDDLDAGRLDSADRGSAYVFVRK